MGFVDSLIKKGWDALISYKTQRIILIKDPKLGLFHKGLLVAATIYLIYTILTSHAYMIKESPATTVNSWVGADRFIQKLNETKYGVRDEPNYCDNDKTDYIFDDDFTYLDNKCDDEAVVAEIYSEESTAVSFTSYYQDFKIDKVGKGGGINAFVPYVEDLELFFSHGFTTSLGVGGANVEATIKSQDERRSKTFKEGEPVNMRISELLEMAGIDLNDRHEDSGGLPPDDDSRSSGWPFYRMTGVDLTLEMNYQNFRSDNVFDFTKRLEATVSATEGVWISRGRSVFLKWDDDSKQAIPHERYPQVISISFRASGELGQVDAFTAIMNIGVSAAILGVAKFVCDSIGDFIVHEFWDKRYLDHGDHLAIKTLKDKVWDEENEREKSSRHLVSKALDASSAQHRQQEQSSGWHLPHLHMPQMFHNMGAWFTGKRKSGVQHHPPGTSAGSGGATMGYQVEPVTAAGTGTGSPAASHPQPSAEVEMKQYQDPSAGLSYE